MGILFRIAKPFEPRLELIEEQGTLLPTHTRSPSGRSVQAELHHCRAGCRLHNENAEGYASDAGAGSRRSSHSNTPARSHQSPIDWILLPVMKHTADTQGRASVGSPIENRSRALDCPLHFGHGKPPFDLTNLAFQAQEVRDVRVDGIREVLRFAH